MQLLISLLSFFISSGLVGWSYFEDVSFSWEYREEVSAKVEMPTFGRRLMTLDGTQIELSGYYLPMELDRKRIIISKQPFASCFFCGGAGGPETVAEIQFSKAPRAFKPDEIVHVKGKLKLNPDDFEHLVFILTDAKVIDE